MLLHVSILRSSSGSVHCSLLKLHVKMLITCMLLLCCIPGREVGRPNSLQGIQHIHVHPICCRITDKHDDIFTILTCNFSKEQCTLPEDDLRIETFRSILSVLVWKFLDCYNITVHLLVCNKLSESIMNGATIKILKNLFNLKWLSSMEWQVKG